MNVVTSWRAGRDFPAPSRARLRTMARKAAEFAGLADLEGTVCISFLTPKAMAKANEAFLSHHGPTDVICFDYRPCDADDVAVELLVCPAVAFREARKRALPYAREVALYVSHGLLHAAGYDDLNPTAKRAMRRAEARVMRALDRENLIPEMTPL